jgi:hypothetical protein
VDVELEVVLEQPAVGKKAVVEPRPVTSRSRFSRRVGHATIIIRDHIAAGHVPIEEMRASAI